MAWPRRNLAGAIGAPCDGEAVWPHRSRRGEAPEQHGQADAGEPADDEPGDDEADDLPVARRRRRGRATTARHARGPVDVHAHARRTLDATGYSEPRP
jgi:hypothetical protein